MSEIRSLVAALANRTQEMLYLTVVGCARGGLVGVSLLRSGPDPWWGFFGPPQELVKGEQVHAKLNGGGSGDDEDRVLVGGYLEPEAAQRTPNPNVRLDRAGAAAHAQVGEQGGANARYAAHDRVEPVRVFQAVDPSAQVEQPRSSLDRAPPVSHDQVNNQGPDPRGQPAGPRSACARPAPSGLPEICQSARYGRPCAAPRQPPPRHP
jgi:hypothetical protein